MLGNYWTGDPLCTVREVLGRAESMTDKGVQPKVTRIETPYAKGGAAHQ